MADGGDMSVAIVASLARFERSLAQIEAVAKRRLAALENGPGQVKVTFDTTSAEESAKVMVQELDRLRAKYDPVFAATQRYEASLKELSLAHRAGVLDARQHEAALESLKAELADASGGAKSAGSTFQNVAFQFQDLAVQISGGTSAARAFSQQLPQMLGGFGVWGAAAGAAVAILVPLAGYLLSGEEAAGALDEQMDRLSSSTGEMVAAVERASRPLSELRAEFGELAEEMANADQAAAMFARIRAQTDLFGAARSIGARAPAPLAPAVVGMDGRVQLDRAQMAAREQAKEMEKLRRETGATEEQLESLIQAWRRLGSTNSAQAAVRDAGHLQRVLAEIADNANLTAEQMAKLTEMARQAGAVQSEAERQVVADTAEAKRLADAYGGTTRELRRLTEDRAAAEKALAAAQKAGNAELMKDQQEVVANIDLQISKTKELARETDTAFLAMSKRVQGYISGALTGGFEGVFGVSPAQYGKDVEAANRGLRELIKLRESGGDYNVTLDNGRWTGGPRDLVNMTLNEVRDLQRQMIANPENRAKYGNGKGSSALGAYQIVGKTLDSLITDLGLTGNELFDPAMQDRLADQLIRRRRGQGNTGLRNEWEGLESVSDAVLDRAKGAASTPRVDPDVQRKLEADVKDRERQAEAVKKYGEQLAANLVNQQKEAELTAWRAAEVAKIEASSMGKADKAAAIAAVNAELEKRRLIYKLMEEAKQRQVTLDAQMDQGAQAQIAAVTGLTAGTITYRQAVEALGEATKAGIVLDQQRQAEAGKLAEAQQFSASMQQQLKDGLIDSIIAGENFADVLKNVAQQLAKAALQAALFGEGPFANKDSGGGLFGGVFKALGFASGGYTGPGGKHEPAGIVHRGEFVMDAATVQAAGGPGAMYALRRGLRGFAEGGYVGGINLPDVASLRPATSSARGAIANININVSGARGNSEIEAMVQSGIMSGLSAYDRTLPQRVAGINRDPRGR